MSVNNNVGFFYEVYTHENPSKPVGFLLGIVHNISPENKQILNLNERIVKAIQNSKIYLPETIMSFNPDKMKELSDTVSLIITTEIDEYIKKSYPIDQHKSMHEKFDKLLDNFAQITNSTISFDQALINTAFILKASDTNKEVLNLEDWEIQKDAVYDIAYKKFSQKNLIKLGDNVLDLQIHKEMSEAWIKGDEETIKYFPDNSYSSKQKMVVRNRRMTDSIRTVAKQKLLPGETFFAFPGVMHLYPYKGEEGIIKRLENEGFVVKRVKP